jgi:RND superfamily putative drug exporter
MLPTPTESNTPQPMPSVQLPNEPIQPLATTPAPAPSAPASSAPEWPEAPEPPTHHAAPEPPPAEPGDPDNGPHTSRSTIENWMAELRSSRRRTGKPDEGRHHGGDGRTVSVNELLRRRDQE